MSNYKRWEAGYFSWEDKTVFYARDLARTAEDAYQAGETRARAEMLAVLALVGLLERYGRVRRAWWPLALGFASTLSRDEAQGQVVV